MSPEIEELLKKAMSLPAAARADLASSLIDSLDQTVDEDVEAAWQQEVARRVEELESGKVKTIPADQVRARARALLRDAAAADIARWFAKLDEFRSEPFCENGIRPEPKK
jgi:putative addiction module component (TIGR02574 family)